MCFLLADINRLLIMSAAALLIVGFSNAADIGFGKPAAYAVVVAGLVVLAVSVYHFLTTKRNAIIPAVSLIS